MNACTFLLSMAVLSSAAHADRWYVNWEDLTCVDDENMPHWSVAYVSKEKCCQNAFWWKQHECDAKPPPTQRPTPAPTNLRGSPSFHDGYGNSSGNTGTSNADNAGYAGDSPRPGGEGDEDHAVNGANSGSSSSSAEKVWLAAVADTYIRNDRPLKNYGNKMALKVGTDGETVALIKFDLRSVRKNLSCVRSATLSLYSLVKSRKGGAVTTLEPNIFSQQESWDETTINWKNAPEEHSYKYEEIGRVGQEKWIDVDVTKLLGRARFETFRIVGGTFAMYASKESQHPPMLSIALC